MKIEYKKEIHKDETGNKSEIFNENRITFRNVEPNKPMEAPCCNGMQTALGYGFCVLKRDLRDRVDLKYEQRQEKAEQPYLCLFTIEAGESFESNEEKYLPLNSCPFCGVGISYECVETKEVIHKCKKETKTEEICTPYTEEKIIER